MSKTQKANASKCTSEFSSPFRNSGNCVETENWCIQQSQLSSSGPDWWPAGPALEDLVLRPSTHRLSAFQSFQSFHRFALTICKTAVKKKKKTGFRCKKWVSNMVQAEAEQKLSRSLDLFRSLLFRTFPDQFGFSQPAIAGVEPAAFFQRPHCRHL